MTVPSLINKLRIVSTGQTSIDFPFVVLNATHLKVLISDANDTPGSRDTLTLSSDYTIDGIGDIQGGSIELINPVTTGWYITLVREVPLTQDTDYEEGGNFTLRQLEQDFDLVYQALQQIKEVVDRVPAVSISSGQSGSALITLIEGFIATAQLAASTAAAQASLAAGYKDQAALSASIIPSTLSDQKGKSVVVKTDESGYELVNLASKTETLTNKKIQFQNAASTPEANTMVNEAIVKVYGRVALNGNVLEGYNIHTVTRVSTGLYEVTFKTPFASANYTVKITPVVDSAYANDNIQCFVLLDTIGVSGFRLIMKNQVDYFNAGFSVIAMGAQ